MTSVIIEHFGLVFRFVDAGDMRSLLEAGQAVLAQIEAGEHGDPPYFWAATKPEHDPLCATDSEIVAQLQQWKAEAQIADARQPALIEVAE